MVTIEQKLSLFSKLLQQDIKDEIGGKLGLIQEEYKQKQQEQHEKVDKEARELVDKAIKRATLKKTEMISKAKMQAKKEEMAAKEKCVNLCMMHLKEKIDTFIKSELYKKYLIESLTALEGIESLTEETVVYMTKEDLLNYESVVRQTMTQKGIASEKLTIDLCKAPIIGGVIVEVPKENMRIDLSIATLIEDHKSLIVERVFEAIGQVGETHE